MANKQKPKMAENKQGANDKRSNGKAWKLRPCGKRHSVNDQCSDCHFRAIHKN